MPKHYGKDAEQREGSFGVNVTGQAGSGREIERSDYLLLVCVLGQNIRPEDRSDERRWRGELPGTPGPVEVPELGQRMVSRMGRGEEDGAKKGRRLSMRKGNQGSGAPLFPLSRGNTDRNRVHKSRSNVLLQVHWKGPSLWGGRRPAWVAPSTGDRDRAMAGHHGRDKDPLKPHVSLELSSIAALYSQSPLLSSNIFSVPTDVSQARTSVIDSLPARFVDESLEPSYSPGILCE